MAFEAYGEARDVDSPKMGQTSSAGETKSEDSMDVTVYVCMCVSLSACVCMCVCLPNCLPRGPLRGRGSVYVPAVKRHMACLNPQLQRPRLASCSAPCSTFKRFVHCAHFSHFALPFPPLSLVACPGPPLPFSARLRSALSQIVSHTHVSNLKSGHCAPPPLVFAFHFNCKLNFQARLAACKYAYSI